MDLRSTVLAILVAGAPAPGINGVISSVTIEALNSGCTVLGFFEGFKQMKQGRSMVMNLTWNDVTQIYDKGGSILRTSKKQIENAQEVDNCLRVLEHHRVRYLVCVGGTQTAYSAYLISQAAQKIKYKMTVAVVPKTIFNDLPLPVDARTFGFSTAREVGTKLVSSFVSDSRTLLRWYILVVVGQKAGHLSLAIGKSSAATVTIIPEDFQDRKAPTFDHIATMLEGAIIKRKSMNKEYGVAILCEGLVNLFAEEEVKERFGNLDDGHQELGNHLTLELQKRFKNKDIEITLVTRNIGCELRSVDPTSYDVLLTRDLGYGAVRFLLDGGNAQIITMKGGELYPIPLHEVVSEKTKASIIRTVNTNEMTYEVAQSYMIKLMQNDLDDMSMLNKLARTANMSVQEFLERFSDVAFPDFRRRKKSSTFMSPMPSPIPSPIHKSTPVLSAAASASSSSSSSEKGSGRLFFPPTFNSNSSNTNSPALSSSSSSQ